MADGVQPERRGKPWGLLALLIGGAALGIVMAALTAASSKGDTRPAARPGSYDLPLAVQDLSVGQPAPDFIARTPDGEAIRLSDLRGSLVALNFWATWCEPCAIEMPELQNAAARYADAGLVVLGVNQAETADEVQTFMDERELTFPVVLDPDQSIAISYGLRGLPTTYWIDADGILRAKHIGMLTADLIDRYVEELLQAVQD